MNEFAYIGIDGNVYLYNICDRSNKQLTMDAQPTERHAYFFFDTSDSWYAGRYVLSSNRLDTVVIDIENDTTHSLGQATFATWSPSGERILMVEFANRLQPNQLTVVKAMGEKKGWTVSGEAPVWLTDDRVIYFQFDQESGNDHILHRLLMSDIDGQEKLLLPQLEKSGSLVRYASLSADKAFLAVYGPGMEFQINLGIIKLDENMIFNMQWITDSFEGAYGGPTFRWSPTAPVLAICTASSGKNFTNIADGAVHLVEWGRPTITVTQPRCGSSSEVSWDPTGIAIAYHTSPGRISIIKAEDGSLLKESGVVTDPSEDDYTYGGPWWSPSGQYIAAMITNKIYIASAADEHFSFEYVVDGLSLSWKK